jgi:hypothetical protein
MIVSRLPGEDLAVQRLRLAQAPGLMMFDGGLEGVRHK